MDIQLVGTNLGDGDVFMETLIDQGEVWWDTRDDAAAALVAREAGVLSRWLTPLDAAHYPGRWHGGLNELQSFHFTIVRGDAWRGL